MTELRTLLRITVVTPVFNEADGLSEFERRVTETLLVRPEYHFDFLFIDDGSTDGSWRKIQDICRRSKHFRGIRLSRNYGAHVALSAGFTHATGDAVATLACDLQDPPETILRFIDEWRAGARIVWGKRRAREDTLWRVIASQLFQRLIGRFAMPPDSKFTTGSFLLVDRRVADCFRQFQEHNRITFALIAWTGFEQAVVEYDRGARNSGVSKWNFGRLMKTMYDAFVGFSLLPVRAMTLTGLGVFAISMLLLAYLVWGWLFGQPAAGWTSQMFLVSFFFGIQFLLMGIMGEYLYRIYAEVVRRPLFFVAETTTAETVRDA